MKLSLSLSIPFLVLFGCDVSSEHPATLLTDAQLQQQFIGTWSTLDLGDEDDIFYVHVSAAGDKKLPAGLMRFLMVSQPQDNKDRVAHFEYLGFFSKLDGQFYLNLMTSTEEDPETEDSRQMKSPDEPHEYKIMKIILRGSDTFEVVQLDADVIEKLVNSGKISGEVKIEQNLFRSKEVRLNAKPDELSKALKNDEKLRLFMSPKKEPATVFHRVTPPVKKKQASAKSERVLKPITNADSVVAIYSEDWGLQTREPHQLIMAIWGDGQIVWSRDRVKGGAPYLCGKVDPANVRALMKRFEKEGYFDNDKLAQARLGPDSHFTTILMKSGKQQLKMQSWHQVFEDDTRLVATPAISSLDGKPRLDVLAKTEAEWLFYRMAWAEVRASMFALIPDEHQMINGSLQVEEGAVSWKLDGPDEIVPDETTDSQASNTLPSTDPLFAAIEKRLGRPDEVSGSGRSFLHYNLNNGDRFTIVVSGTQIVGSRFEVGEN